MRITDLIARLFLLALIATLSIAQTKTPVSQPLPTIDEQLNDHKIPSDRRNVVEALQNSDGEVRALAALKLASDKAAETAPQISDVLKNERVPEVRIQLAFALAELGEKSGTASLKSLCDDSTQLPSIRLGAAQNMLELHNEDCLSDVLAILDDSTESGTEGYALGVLSGFRQTLKQHPRMVIDPIVNLLASPSPYVRISASGALENLAASSAIPQLEVALAREQDQGVRAQMEVDLRILRRKALSKEH